MHSLAWWDVVGAQREKGKRKMLWKGGVGRAAVYVCETCRRILSEDNDVAINLVINLLPEDLSIPRSRPLLVQLILKSRYAWPLKTLIITV